MVATAGRRAKQLLRELARRQDEDVLLTAPTSVEIKFTLQHSGRCREITVEGNSFDPLLFFHPYRSEHPDLVPWEALPQFLASQLEAQNVTNSCRAWEQLQPILTFVSLNLPQNKAKHHSPTLFSWYSVENHRTYAIFAFLKVKMESSKYSAADLLQLRQVKLTQGPLERTSSHRALGESSTDGHRAAPPIRHS